MEIAKNRRDEKGPFFQRVSEKVKSGSGKKAGHSSSPARAGFILKGQWGENALRVMKERYLQKAEGKVQETADGMFERVARSIAQAEERWGKTQEEIDQVAEAFYEMMVTQRFMPNSPTLMNAGKNNGLQYSACYVLPVEDSIKGIFDSIKNAAIIHQSGGGTGFSFSRLRHKGAVVSTTQGEASGPVSFLRVFNEATNSIKQGGTRRGANMGILRYDHPDIMEFVLCKRKREITNFNISVGASDDFIQRAKDGRDYELVGPSTGESVKTMNARKVFDEMVESAWLTGDPGLIFMDKINGGPSNPVPKMGPVEATNPCGEQPLYPNEACNLASINLMSYAVLKKEKWEIDWESLEENVRLGVRFLDNVIEVNPYPLPEIDYAVKSNRRIGLGVMGWTHLLFRLGIPYDSQDALDLAKRIMKFINEIGHNESENLAVERGPFPNWSESIYRSGRPLRNSTVTTIAPTGTISIIAGCSSGIEPVFALAFRHIVGERKLDFVDPVFEDIAKEHGFWSEEVIEAVKEKGSIEGIKGIPEDLRNILKMSHQIPFEWHIRMQGAFQEYTDNAVSKTINLPHSATREDVKKAYLMAFDLGCLGITIFRDGCLDEQVLNIGVKQGVKAEKTKEAGGPPQVKPRPYKRTGTTLSKETPLGTVHITMNDDDEGPAEVFITIGKAGSDIMAMAEGFGRFASLYLRTPSPLSRHELVQVAVNQLKGIGGSRSVGFGEKRVSSLPDAIARAMEEHWLSPKKEGNGHETKPVFYLSGNICPKCGINMVREEGCQKCYNCFYSEC